MAAGDVTSELMYELLRSMNTRLGRMEDRLDRMDGELQTIRGHVATLVQSDLYRGNEAGRMGARVDRIERRLDLHDPGL